MQTSRVSVVPHIDIVLLIDSGTTGVELLVKTLQDSRKLNFKGGDSERGTQTSTVQLSDFVVKLYRRQVSSPTAKQKRYAYRGQIFFKYNDKPTQVQFSYRKNGEARSLKSLIEKNLYYIVARAKQHFKLKNSDILASELLASIK